MFLLRLLKLVVSAGIALSILSFFILPEANAAPKDWEACAKGRKLLAKNIPSGTKHDVDPLRDHVVLRFNTNRNSTRSIQHFADKNGLDLVPVDVKHGIYRAVTQEGHVPYIKTCLRASYSRSELLSIEESVLYYHTGMPTLPQNRDLKAKNSYPVDDPMYDIQWNFHQIGMEKAWKVSKGAGVIVAVIDTGIALEPKPNVEEDSLHKEGVAPDLKGTDRVDGYSFVEELDVSFDDNGHGTHVAGTIAQTTNNGFGVAGIAYKASLMSLRVLGTDGSGTSEDVAAAIFRATDDGAHVINLSLGSSHPSNLIGEAILYARKNGVFVVASAGNEGTNEPNYPAAQKGAYAVAATQWDRTTTFYSQWGTFIDIAAPGGNVTVDQNGDGIPDGILQETLSESSPYGFDFALYMGTSMAAPHVAGVAALLVSIGISNPAAIERILSKSADTSMKKETGSDFSQKYGAGILRADKAISYAILNTGNTRMFVALALLSLALLFLRREKLLLSEYLDKKTVSVLAFLTALFSAGLYPLAFFLSPTENPLTMLLIEPVARWDALILGTGQTLLFASVAIPVLATLVLLSSRLKVVAAALCFGMGGFLIAEAYLVTSLLTIVPSITVFWFWTQGLMCLGLGFLSIKKG